MSFVKVFATNTGPLALEFTHVPIEPTMEQIQECLPHTCFTCRWRYLRFTNHCRAPELPEGRRCNCWDTRYDAMEMGEQEYYRRLHAQTVAGYAV